MAHYDCSNCGASMGINFGYCDSCTPKEYKELLRKKSTILTNAKAAWDSEMAHIIKRFEDAKIGWIEARTRNDIAAINELIHNIEMEHHHSYRRQYERERGTK